MASISKVSTSSLFDGATERMSTLQKRLATVQAQLSEGKQVLSPSDAPDKAAAIQRINSVLSRQTSYQSALDNVKTRLNGEETSLSSASDIMVRIKELTVQSANDTLGPQNRQALAVEMQALRDQLLSLANTRDSNGNYLFAGSKVPNPPLPWMPPGIRPIRGIRPACRSASGINDPLPSIAPAPMRLSVSRAPTPMAKRKGLVSFNPSTS